jgi:hypothetical protein
MKILQTEEGFLWGVVTDKAVDFWELNLGALYVLYEDGTEAMVETIADIEEALSNDMDIAIEIGYVEQKIRGRVDWETADKKIIDGFVYIKSTDILFCE